MNRITAALFGIVFASFVAYSGTQAYAAYHADQTAKAERFFGLLAVAAQDADPTLQPATEPPAEPGAASPTSTPDDQQSFGTQTSIATTSISTEAVDMFLKMDGIAGESVVKGQEGAIPITAFNWSLKNPVTVGSGGATAGKVKFSELALRTALSKASPLIVQHAAMGKRIPKATLTLRKRGESPQDYYKVTLSDVIISSYSQASEGRNPTDRFSLSFSRIEIEYRAQKPDGSLDTPVKAGWDLKTNSAL